MGTSAVIVSPGENTERSVGLMFVFVSVRWAPPVVWATVQPAATAEATTSAPVGELPPRGSAGRWSAEIIKPKRSGSSAGNEVMVASTALLAELERLGAGDNCTGHGDHRAEHHHSDRLSLGFAAERAHHDQVEAEQPEDEWAGAKRDDV